MQLRILLGTGVLLISACTDLSVNEKSERGSTEARYRLKHRAYIGAEEIREYDVRLLAESLIQRLHDECDSSGGNVQSANIINSKSQVILMFSSKAIRSAGKYGIANQHITQTTTGGVPARKFRYNTEQELVLMRLPYSSKGRELLPKYAILNLKSPDLGHFPIPKSFGDIGLVLKDSVKNRVTWTYSDSLEIPFFSERETFQFPPHTTQFAIVPNNIETCRLYCEAQIWGDLDLTDVDYILVAKSAQVPESLRELGIPVYSWEINQQSVQSLQIAERELVLPGQKHLLSKPMALTLAEVRAGKEMPAVSEVTGHILQNMEFGQLGEEELLKKIGKVTGGPESVANAISRDVSADPARDFYGEGFTEKEYLVAEIATRVKSQAILVKLQELLTDPDEYVRQQAYYGLMEQPFLAVKPLILQCLKDQSRLVVLGCIGYGADFIGQDHDIASAIDSVAMTSQNDPVLLDWIKRLKSRSLCD